jgi:hypothetical protein
MEKQENKNRLPVMNIFLQAIDRTIESLMVKEREYNARYSRNHSVNNSIYSKKLEMNLYALVIGIILFCLTSTSCNKEKTSNDFSQIMSNIPPQKYFSTEVLNEKYQDMYGIWKVIGTSGGFAGMGYDEDFEYLVLKPNGIFGILRNDSLISYGKLSVTSQTETTLVVEFIPDTEPGLVLVEITADREKYIEMEKNELDLIAPCCDRFNTHLEKVD